MIKRGGGTETVTFDADFLHRLTVMVHFCVIFCDRYVVDFLVSTEEHLVFTLPDE